MASLLFLLSYTVIYAQGFEGTIEFKKTKGSKVSTYIYHVKGNKVRLEEYGTKKTLTEIALIDLETSTIQLLSPDRQSYMVLHTKPSTKDMSKTEVVMTKDKKTIMGKECSKWVITNEDLNATVTYWVTKGDYDFFVTLLATLNRKTNQTLFFQQVPAAMGYFPMVGVETDLAGAEKERLEVTSMNKKALGDHLFKVPSGYTEIEN